MARGLGVGTRVNTLAWKMATLRASAFYNSQVWLKQVSNKVWGFEGIRQDRIRLIPFAFWITCLSLKLIR